MRLNPLNRKLIRWTLVLAIAGPLAVNVSLAEIQCPEVAQTPDDPELSFQRRVTWHADGQYEWCEGSVGVDHSSPNQVVLLSAVAAFGRTATSQAREAALAVRASTGQFTIDGFTCHADSAGYRYHSKVAANTAVPYPPQVRAELSIELADVCWLATNGAAFAPVALSGQSLGERRLFLKFTDLGSRDLHGIVLQTSDGAATLLRVGEEVEIQFQSSLGDGDPDDAPDEYGLAIEVELPARLCSGSFTVGLHVHDGSGESAVGAYPMTWDLGCGLPGGA